MPKRTALADLVRVYVLHVEQIYPSREPANIKSALARLVALEEGPPTRHHKGERASRSPQPAHPLDADQLARKARKLAENLELSTSYRRACIARWKRFLLWAVEHEHCQAEHLVRFDVACKSLRFRAKREDDQVPPGAPSVSAPSTLPFGPGTLFSPRAVFDAARDVAAVLPPVPRDLLRLLAFTGARPIELLRLRTVDLVFNFFATDDPSAVAVLRRHKTAHHGRPRFLVFGPHARSILDNHLRPFTPHDWIFPAPNNPARHATTHWLAQQVHRAYRRHSLPPLKLYDLRRAAATLTRARDGLDAAQVLLGHATARTTELYAPPDLAPARRAASHLEEAWR